MVLPAELITFLGYPVVSAAPDRQLPILIYRCLLQHTVSVLHEGRLVRLHPVDLAANASARRSAGRPPEEDRATPPVFSAARLAFERDFSPVTDADGGFVRPRLTATPLTEPPPSAPRRGREKTEGGSKK